MIKVVYLFNKNSQINMFLERMIDESRIKNEVNFEYVEMNDKPEIAEKYKVTQWHTVIFEYEGKVLVRIDRVFCSEDLKIAYEAAVQQLRNM